MSKISILKIKLKRAGSEVVSATNQLKLLAPDGKNSFSGTRQHEYVPENGFSGTRQLGYVPQNGFSGTWDSDTYIVRTHSPIY